MLKVSLRINVIKNSKLLLKINKEENKRMVQCFTFYHEWCSTQPFLPPIWTSVKPGTRHEQQLLRWYVKLGGGGGLSSALFKIMKWNVGNRFLRAYTWHNEWSWDDAVAEWVMLSKMIPIFFFQLLRHDAYCPVLKTVLLRLESGQFIANQIWEWLMW